MQRARVVWRVAVTLGVVGLMLATPSIYGDETPEGLLRAAQTGDLDAVLRALDAGVPMESQDRYGATALSMAARNGHREVVELLLKRGADPDAVDTFYGMGAVSWALANEHEEIAVLLLEHGAESREAALQMAVAQERLELARAAVKAGPIHQTVLRRLRQRELSPEVSALLKTARSRPDPPPPVYTVEELRNFSGSFEGRADDTEAEVSVRDGALYLQLGEQPAQRLEAVGEKRFQAVEGELEASFSGRVGSVEGLVVRRPEAAPVGMRRSVASVVGPGAVKLPRPEESEPVAPTVHWPSFRGLNASGVGDGADPPTQWDLETGEGVLWQAEVPGLGHASPVIWGDRVYVTTAVAGEAEQSLTTGLTGAGTTVDESVEHRWLVLAFDKASGKKLWEAEAGRAVPLTERHFKATQANSTPATDGRYLVAVFPTAGLVCLDLDGTVRWKVELGGLNAGAFNDPGLEWGFASSPILHGDRVILQVDVHGGQYLAAWDLESGEQVWRTERDVAPSWATPTLFETADGPQLVVNGSTIHGYDALTGKELWSLGPNSELVIATPVVGDGVVYVSAGYPPVKPIYALGGDLRGDLEVNPRAGDERLRWSVGIGGAYMPTPLLYRGLLYVVHHNGRLVAYDAATGKAIYKQRFSQRGAFTASPVAANGKIYTTTEEGHVFIFTAGPEYEELAVHEMGEPVMATPAISEGILFLRTPSRLLALGEGKAPSSPSPRIVGLERLYFDRIDDPAAPGSGLRRGGEMTAIGEELRRLLPTSLDPGEGWNAEERVIVVPDAPAHFGLAVRDLPLPGGSDGAELVLRQVVDGTHPRIREQYWALYADRVRADLWFFSPTPDRTDSKLLAPLAIEEVLPDPEGLVLRARGSMIRPQGAGWLQGVDLHFSQRRGELRFRHAVRRYSFTYGYDLGDGRSTLASTEAARDRDGRTVLERRLMADYPRELEIECGVDPEWMFPGGTFDEMVRIAGCIASGPSAVTRLRASDEPSFIERGGRPVRVDDPPAP